jgi:hypothetical protein
MWFPCARVLKSNFCAQVMCDVCGEYVDAVAFDEHADFHVAVALHNEERAGVLPHASRVATTTAGRRKRAQQAMSQTRKARTLDSYWCTDTNAIPKK